MKKEILVVLLFIASTVTAFAGEDTYSVANIEKKSSAFQIPVPAVTENYEYYEIRGENEKELRRQMKEKGTKWADGKTYDALTSWNIDWNYGYDRSPQGCKANDFSTTLKIVFRYPKWARGQNAPQPLAAKWDRYMENLIAHENGHRDIAVKGVEEISRAATALPPAATCADLDRRISALGREIMAKLDNEQKAYDFVTGHGRTQGAVFP